MTDHHSLYRTILEAIVDHFDALGHLHGEAVIVDAKEVKRALIQLLAEVLATIDDDDDRARVLSFFVSKAVIATNEIRAKGLQAPAFRPS